MENPILPDIELCMVLTYASRSGYRILHIPPQNLQLGVTVFTVTENKYLNIGKLGAYIKTNY